MKIELESTDLQRIADMVADRILPLLQPPTNVKTNGKADDYYLDLPDLCKYMAVSERWIYDKVSQKRIPYHRVGGVLRFSKKEIDKYLLVRSNN